MRKITIILAALFACCAILPGRAQTADSVSVSRGYNAKSLRLQKRYRPIDADEFTKERFLSNTFAGVSFDYYMPLTEEYINGPVASFYAGKFFTPCSGLRVLLNMGMLRDSYLGRRQGQIGLTADYMLNFSSLTSGYNKYRPCEFSGIVGAGFIYIKRRGAFHFNPSGHIGVNANFHIFKMLDLFVEPKVEVFGNKGYESLQERNFHGYGVAFNCSFGLAVRGIDNPDWKRTPGLNWYVLASGGMNWQNSALVRANGIAKNMGGAAALGVGLHYLEWLDFQVSGKYAMSGWSTDASGMRLNTHYGSIRFEALFDVVNMIAKRDDCLFSAGFLFGPEMGGMKKYISTGAPIERTYFGFTAALQVKCRLSENVKLFAEPRMSIVPYTAQSFDPAFAGYNKLFYDGLVNVNLGIEYHFK